MTRIVVDAATAAKLADLREAVELVDEAGNILAVGRPTGPSPEVREWARQPFPPGAFAPFTDEEVRASLDALARGEQGRPLAAIIEDFKKR